MVSLFPLMPSLFSVSLGVLLLGCNPVSQSSTSPGSSSTNPTRTPAEPPVSHLTTHQSAPSQPAPAQPAPSPAAVIPPASHPSADHPPASNPPTGQTLPITAQALMRGQTIQLEVARTFHEQAMGLMYRPALPDDRGMLFPFNPPRPLQFWMKNTPQPLDMVFMLDGEVKAIAPNSPPCTADPCPTYGTNVAVNQVIELRAGRASELGLQIGDRVEIRYLNPPTP